MSDTPTPLPPAAAMISHPVADFASWKAGFDAHEDDRRAAGILGHHVNRGEEDPNLVAVYMAIGDIDRARAFAESEELKAKMAEVGVTGPPEISWMTPVREGIVWDRELPAFSLTHSVADFDRWLDGYDAADDLRRRNGIVGQAANRSLDDPSVAVVYHQAESFEALRSFLGNAELQTLMEEAGVTSAPDVSFYTGGWAKQYG